MYYNCIFNIYSYLSFLIVYLLYLLYIIAFGNQQIVTSMFVWV
jgi:hypothetical protein